MVSVDSVKTYILNHFYEIEKKKKGENEKDKKNPTIQFVVVVTKHNCFYMERFVLLIIVFCNLI